MIASIRIAFRVEVSARAGGGHAIRSLALAQALAARGVVSHFFVGRDALDVVPDLRRHTTVVLKEPHPHFPGGLSALWPDGADAVVIDDYGYDAAMENELRNMACLVMVIDERLDRRHEANIMLDQTYGRHADEVRALVPDDCEVLVGEHFALVRSEFTGIRSRGLPARSRGVDAPCRAFVSVGLTDPGGVIDLVLRELEPLNGRLSVDVAIGSGAPNLAELRRHVARLPWATLHVDHPAIWDLMALADIAIGAAGVMSWERCCVGLPAIVLVLAENQQPNACALAQAGAAIVLGAPDALAAGALTAAVLRLSENRDVCVTVGQAAAALIDGRGAERVADRLLARISAARAAGRALGITPAGG